MLLFPQVCVCVYMGENRTVSAVSVSSRKVEGGKEDEKLVTESLRIKLFQ